MLNTKIIGNRIAAARKKMNMSQAQLAQRLFISPQAVGKWERGESMPDIITLNRLAEILTVDLNYFSEGLEPMADEIPVELSEKEPAELTSSVAVQSSSEVKEKKLNWDMSHGNWVDADFSGLKNLHEKFSSANMQRCKFIGSNLSGLLLKNNHVDNCDFSSSDISNSQFQNSHLMSNLFNDTLLKEAEFSRSYIKGCDFSDANLIGVRLQKSSHVESCGFSNSDISSGYIQNSSLANNIFNDCCLEETDFSESHIKGCDFSGANFTGAKFKSGSFVDNTIEDAVWSHTSFIGIQLEDIIFEGSLEDCYFENCTFKRITFQNSTLINTFFKNNSLKRIQFIGCKVDKITYAFLKNGKADMADITLATP
ncbi:pentapeptide repeat-containing protein [Chryseobacterium lathyri]|uniref:Uncharacterized protein YjbI with pentapeptide repeats/DNA-binding XRE family transcriptional regulator n=1 Tax=Chryseobacterium lathyri TaxID=395933 RepID=A0ABT9SQK7_9FLAO|nr:pentapeptide repeat-containing protein [Chryseobacterium lathyri]MDP9960735.1 uncharacterized protein YjbI with pentapeptide repeats/DNA-binding XRE family transcriptional regulator [Chryseobacterium lathyri]